MHHEHRKAILLALANQLLIPRPTTAPEDAEMEDRALRSTRSTKALEPQAVHGAGAAPAQWRSRRDQSRADLLTQLHGQLGITQQPDDDDAVVLSSDDESEIGAPPQEEEKEEEEEEEAPLAVEHPEHARAREKGTVPSPKGAPSKRVQHSRHMLSQALADAVADRGAYPLGAHVRDELAPAGRRFDPWSATVIGPQVPPTALAADDAPWTDLWASDPKAVGRLRPLTHAVGRSLAKTAEQHKTVLTDTAREYGERKIKASICGPHSREGDREGGEGLAGKGHKRQRLEDLGAKKRYATSIKYRGAPARALTKTELYAQPRPATKKHLVSQCLSNKPWFGLFELPPTLPPPSPPPFCCRSLPTEWTAGSWPG